jgi:hypothetical protein
VIDEVGMVAARARVILGLWLLARLLILEIRPSRRVSGMRWELFLEQIETLDNGVGMDLGDRSRLRSTLFPDETEFLLCGRASMSVSQ